MSLSLYVHVPFCEAKCAYCDFASWAGRGGEENGWLERLGKELGLRGEEAAEPLSSVFFGGGTPSALSERGIARLCGFVSDNFRLTRDAEWSMEANPVSLTPAKLRAAREGGVGRVSLGVQSLEPGLLASMGRAHDREGAIQAMELLAGSGLRWSADLIFALPGQSTRQFLSSLDEVLGRGPGHVSFYGLTIEPDTRFGRMAARGEMAEADEELYVAMYEEGVARLAADGVRRYEVSNFARAGEECRHNQAYWDTRSSWLAAGNAAHGYVPHVRVRNPRGLDEWSAWVDAGCPPQGREPEILTREERWTEEWFLGLRTAAGVDLERLSREFPEKGVPHEALRKRSDLGHVDVREGRARLVGTGWLLLDAIAVEMSK